MLEKDDLNKIKEIVEEVVDKKLDQRFSEQESRLDKKLDQRFSEQESKLDQKLAKNLKPIHKKLNKLQKDLDVTIRSFDNDHLKNSQRIERIENHLHLPHFTS